MPYLPTTLPWRTWYYQLCRMKYSPLHSGQHADPISMGTWRPWTLRMPFFISFAILCAILSITVEIIARGCFSDGCHVFGAMSASRVSYQSNFVYNLVPTALSVALGLLWAIVHQDVMRLEPYFQMSAKGGATAEDSLFLKYPYEIAPFLPYKAGKRRHYAVLLSSCVLLLMNFFVTPLISGIFTDTILEKKISFTAKRNALYTEDSNLHTTSSFGYTAYTYNWLGGSMPPFTAPTYALLPVADAIVHPMVNESWSANTTLFEMELTCETVPTTISYPPSGPEIDIPRVGSEFMLTFNPQCDSSPDSCYLGTTFATPWTSTIQPIRSELYGKDSAKTHIVSWARGTENPTVLGSLPLNLTVLSCNSSFYMQQVAATFAASSGKVLVVSRHGLRMPFLSTSGFGGAISGYSQIKGGVIQVTSIPPQYLDGFHNVVGLGYIPPFLPRTDYQIQRQLGPCPKNISGNFIEDSCSMVQIWSGDSMTGFMMNDTTPDMLGEFLDPQTLEDRYQKAFQLLFSLWVAREMVDINATEPVTVTRHLWIRGFVVDRRGAWGVQCGLGVVIVITVVLSMFIRGRRCELDGEPNSLAEALRLLSGSLDLTARMENAEFHAPEAILDVLSENDRQYTLEFITGKGSTIRVTAARAPLIPPALYGPESPDIQASRGLCSQDQESPQPWKEKPWQLRPITGVGIVLGFGAVLSLLITMFSYSRKHNGLPMFATTDSVGYKVLFSYVPTGISVSLKTILVTLGSCHCMFGPYKALYPKSAPASRSLAIDYDTSPPHFQLLRCIRTGDVALAALTVAILLSHILPVTFSGLFLPISTKPHSETEVMAYPDVKINGGFSQPAEEMYYILSEYLVHDLPAQTWTTPEYYILPFYPLNRNASSYEATTLGIGVEITCGLVLAKNTSCGDVNRLPTSACGNRTYLVSVDDPCSYPQGSGYFFEWSMRPSSDGLLGSENCSSTFFAIWGERPGNPHPNGSLEPYQNKVDAVILKCTTRDKIVELTATVNQGERVNSTSDINPLNSKRVSALYPSNTSATQTLSSTFFETVQDSINAQQGRAYSGTSGPMPDDPDQDPSLTWFNHLMVAVEPLIVQKLPNITHIPNSSHLADTFENVYKQLFAINLQLYAKDILNFGLPRAKPGTETLLKDRVNVSNLMFKISAVILIFNVVVLYSLKPPRVPYQPPTTLASMYTALYASNAKEECRQLVGDDPEERAERLVKLGGSYTYGEFGGEGGSKHFGVYRVKSKKL